MYALWRFTKHPVCGMARASARCICLKIDTMILASLDFFRLSAVVDISIKATQASLRAAGVPSVVKFMKSLRLPERVCSNQA